MICVLPSDEDGLRRTVRDPPHTHFPRTSAAAGASRAMSEEGEAQWSKFPEMVRRPKCPIYTVDIHIIHIL